MALKKDKRRVIHLHDTTDHDGDVIEVKHKPQDAGLPIACIGDMVFCPRCLGKYPIIEGDPEFTIDGDPVALEGHKTACGAKLISKVVG